MRTQKGMTLIELAVLSAMLSILALSVAPSIVTPIQSIRLNNAAQKLAADIRYARSLALSHHKVYGVDFDQNNDSTLDGTGYSVFEIDGGTQTTINDPHRNGNFVMDYSAAEYSGVSITSAGSVEIRVDAFGKPYNSAGTALTSPLTITLTNGSLTRNVTVTNETGFVEIV